MAELGISENRERVKALPWLAALVFMAFLAAFLPSFFGKTVVDRPEVFDIGYQWIPFAAFLKRSLLSGFFPLWDPHDLCGTPFLAFPHTGTLYLPAALFHLATDSYHAAARLDIFFHLSIAGLAAFWFFKRAWAVGNTSAFCAAAAYAFSGFVFSNINVPPALHSGAWLCLFYAGGFPLLSRARFRDFVLCSLGFGLMLSGGDFELAIYGLLGFGFEVLLRWGEGKVRGRGFFAAGISILLGGLLAAPLVLPALELQRHSVRAGGMLLSSSSPGPLLILSAMALINLPVPPSKPWSNHGLDPFYLGAFLILCAVFSVKRDRAAARRLLIFPAAVIYLAFMYLPGFRLLFSRIPFLSGLMVPLRGWPVLTLFFLAAAGRGMDGWLREIQEHEEKSGRFPGLPLGRAGSAFLFLFSIVTLISLAWIQKAAFFRAGFCLFLLLVSTAGLRSSWAGVYSRGRARTAVAVACVGLDLYGLALSWLPMNEMEIFKVDPRLRSLLAETSGRFRYFISSIRGSVDPGLPYHLGLRLNADTIDSFSRVPPRNAAERLALLFPSILEYRKGRLKRYDQMGIRSPDKLDRSRLSLFSLMNVSLILSRYRLPVFEKNPGFRLERSGPELFVYRNLEAGPRAFVEGKGGTKKLRFARTSPDSFLVFPEGAEITGKANKVRVMESWYPGWRAFSGSRELKIWQDELGFMKIELQRETGFSASLPIKFVFVPLSFRTGLYGGLGSLLVFAAICFLRAGRLGFHRKERKKTL